MWVNDLYNVFQVREWGYWIVFYFYILGISAGACSFSVFKIDKHKPLALSAAVLAFLGFVLGPAVLIFDLTQPLRFWHVMVATNYNLTSSMSFGANILSVYPFVLLVYCALLYLAIKRGDSSLDRHIKILAPVVLASAVLVHLYTGFVFGVLKSRGFAFSAILPLYMLAGAIVSGYALMQIYVIAAHYIGKRREREWVPWDFVASGRRTLYWVIWGYPLFTFSHLLTNLLGPQEAYLASLIQVKEILFWGGEIGMGIATPLFLLWYSRTRDSLFWQGIASLGAMSGVLIMRYGLVFLSQTIPLD